jgi:dihydrofolate synthase/folylpolyglutamate synthase
MNPIEARSFLYRLRHGGSRYGRPRMWRMLEAMGNPQWAVPSIHVAGTNDKGSVCAMLEIALRRAGFRTGLFTSPHLIYQGERIQVDRTILSEDKIAEYTIELKEVADRIFPEGDPVGYLSFFEFMTVMSFVHFQRSGVDINLIETGLGGRLDSTNVLKPLVCVVTSIGMDHMDILGSEITQIAAEKAGIFHSGVPAVLGPMSPEVREVFEKTARELQVPLYWTEDLYGEGRKALPETALEGEHQRWNAAVAQTVLELLPEPFSRALAGAVEAFREVEWAGRWQHLSGGNVPVWVDAAHNEAGVRQLRRLLERKREDALGKWTFIMGATGLDRARAFVDLAGEFAEVVHILEPEHPRATTFAEWQQLFAESGHKVKLIHGTVAGLFPKPGRCQVDEHTRRVLVTGSLYLIGDILDRWTNDPPVSQNFLQDR